MQIFSEKDNLLLYRKTQAHLENLVRQGILRSGDKIPGERVLSSQLRVSRDTVRAALRELEAQNFLIRVPAKGTFIRGARPVRSLNIAFVYPIPEISLVYQDYDHYVINSEVWRGIVSKCAELGGTVSFKALSPELAKKDAEKIAGELMREYAGVIFPSTEFSKISKIMNEAGFPNVDCVEQVFYDQERAIRLAAGVFLENRCRSVLLLSCQSNKAVWERKVAVFKDKFKSCGIELPDENIVLMQSSREKMFQRLSRIFDKFPVLPDGVFCASPSIGMALLQLAAQKNWQIPENMKIVGYGNDMLLQPTIPALTHVKLPHAEIGAEAVRLIAQMLYKKEPIPAQSLLKAELIPGDTAVCAADADILNVI